MKRTKRSLKVQAFLIPCKRHHSAPTKTVPSLKLQGRWLYEAGFLPDSIVDILVEEDCITIKPCKPIIKFNLFTNNPEI